MGSTTLGIPYAELTDAPNGPVQDQAQAEAIDALLQLRGVKAFRRVHEPDGPIGVPNATYHPIAAYGDPVNLEVDPLNLITFSGGIFTLGAPGAWGWKAMVRWPAVTGAPAHIRTAHVLRNGILPTDDDGSAAVPWPAGDWGGWPQAWSGTVNATGSATTLQLEIYQASGGYIEALEASFAVWAIALS